MNTIFDFVKEASKLTEAYKLKKKTLDSFFGIRKNDDFMEAALDYASNHMKARGKGVAKKHMEFIERANFEKSFPKSYKGLSKNIDKKTYRTMDAVDERIKRKLKSKSK